MASTPLPARYTTAETARMALLFKNVDDDRAAAEVEADALRVMTSVTRYAGVELLANTIGLAFDRWAQYKAEYDAR